MLDRGADAVTSKIRTRTEAGIVGEVAVLGDGPRNASISARDAAEVLELGRATFAGLLGASPETSGALDRACGDKGSTRVIRAAFLGDRRNRAAWS